MKKILLLISVIIISSFNKQLFAQTVTEDTTIVQTFTYQSPQDAWFNFPSDTNHYRKILMQYKLHCPDPTQCGEWDYLTYTYLYDHTGEIDSTLFNHPSFMIENAAPDSFPYMNNPSQSYHYSEQYSLVIDNLNSSSSSSIGAGVTQSFHPFHTGTDTRARTVYLYKASELNVGLIAGNITSLTLNAAFSWGTELNHLKIRIALTPLDSLEDSQLSAAWLQVYNHNTYLTSGLNIFQFTQPYSWNGTSNVLVEISYDNNITGWDDVLQTTPETFSGGITSTDNDRDVSFNADEFIQVPGNAFANVDSFITIAYWAYGDPATQPNDGTCFEAVDSLGQRVLNAHCPWSNNNIYWDAGNTGSNFDRINSAASNSQIEGQWNYWTFTKNCVTGVMNIYCNGNLFLSGSGMTRLMKNIAYFRIGKGNWNGAQSYRGNMDEFAVWNVELDSTTIRAYMYKDLDALHPFYSNLLCYYKFNDHNGVTFMDSSSGNYTATIMGQIDNNLIPAQTLFRNYTKLYERPNIIFNEDVFTSHIDTVIEIDTVENTSIAVVIYGDTLTPTIPTDTIWVYPSSNYSYNADGTIDTTGITPDSVLYKHLWYWYGPAFEIVNRYELGRFITLYGNGTSLGSNGRTWVYDLTNLAPLLHDSVHLSAGNWQEWLDMRFLMIKGKPARDPISVVNLWNGDYGHNSLMETYLHPLRVKIDPLAQNTMWRTITTGHGQNGQPNYACDEFCQNSQYGKVNGVQHFNQLIWRDDCGRNPLFPQGGTWIYQRANWCPGSEVREYDWELTPYVTPGDSVTLDLDYDPPGLFNGNYVIACQLISFKQPNFSLDAEMYDILAPNDHDEWSRINPICSEPQVRIRNGGTTPLTSATITYGLDGGTVYTYDWTGNLPFLQTADVTLPSMWWVGNGSNKFYATISSPNSGTDLNLANNTEHTHFNAPAIYNLISNVIQKFVLEVKTNANGNETSYQLRGTGGVVLVDRNNLSSNTFYRDTIDIDAYNCYTFEIFDGGEDGLNFWANPSQGSGYARLKRADFPLILKSFPADFGAEYIHNFKVNWALGTQEIKNTVSSIVLAPNPAVDFIDVTVQMTEPSAKVEAVLTDMSGRVLKTQTQKFNPANEFNFDTNDLAQGLYFVKVRSGNEILVQKFIKVND